ncbi:MULTISPECIES: hypothetical protein [Halobacterium]|uniref:hypothetical protein n=1 Tax=Halobacterium TaxID=2239 RepID=UPI00073E151A|nr:MULTISPECIES: hypothetical protein [Halobacterium]MCG1004358.1 hypothetical protein [Halobacterium noricense]
MRQLDTCDFCGGAADGVYEVVPASVAGESRRLALCADCRATLQSVVDPLLDAAAEGPDSAPERSEVNDNAEATPERDSSAAESEASDESTEDGIVIESQPASESEDADDEDSDKVADDGSEDDDTEDSDDSSATQSKRRPSGYAQVIRLLQNRDGAMPREDLRALATNAYDLGGREFENAVEAAVENGDVEESAAGLRTI